MSSNSTLGLSATAFGFLLSYADQVEQAIRIGSAFVFLVIGCITLVRMIRKK